MKSVHAALARAQVPLTEPELREMTALSIEATCAQLDALGSKIIVHQDLENRVPLWNGASRPLGHAEPTRYSLRASL